MICEALVISLTHNSDSVSLLNTESDSSSVPQWRFLARKILLSILAATPGIRLPSRKVSLKHWRIGKCGGPGGRAHGNIGTTPVSHGNIGTTPVSHGNIGTRPVSHGNIGTRPVSHGYGHKATLAQDNRSQGNIGTRQ